MNTPNQGKPATHEGLDMAPIVVYWTVGIVFVVSSLIWPLPLYLWIKIYLQWQTPWIYGNLLFPLFRCSQLQLSPPSADSVVCWEDIIGFSLLASSATSCILRKPGKRIIGKCGVLIYRCLKIHGLHHQISNWQVKYLKLLLRHLDSYPLETSVPNQSVSWNILRCSLRAAMFGL